ncbi:MAG: ribonuclease III [Chloroflexota bacterium]|nr:ribonuclease III [Dehalococcoidia bacterium]MDW8253352.1 ribonuclease III [Chloroflexota bacterium]
MPELSELVARLGTPMTRPDLLQQALVHRSVVNERPNLSAGTNERLEFLGDAVLGFLIADALYQRLPNASEGELTALRASIVRKETLAAAARKLELGRWLLLGRGEEASGGRERDQILAAAFEAVVGAVYLSDGLAHARTVVLRELGPIVEEVVATGPRKDDKSRLQELTQARWQLTPVYELLEAVGPDHAKEFLVEVRVGAQVAGRGRGRTKQAAEQMAARQALASLTGAPAEASPAAIWPRPPGPEARAGDQSPSS